MDVAGSYFAVSSNSTLPRDAPDQLKSQHAKFWLTLASNSHFARTRNTRLDLSADSKPLKYAFDQGDTLDIRSYVFSREVAGG